MTLLTVVSCDTSSPEVPASMCGTRIEPGLSRPLLEPLGEFDEFNRLDPEHPKTAPCVVSVDGDPALRFRLAFHSESPDLMKWANESSIVGLTNPSVIDLGFEASVVGNEGAIATEACRTAEGDRLTLSVVAPRVPPAKENLRPAIEKFMKAYMNNTIAMLGCGGTKR
ncbi:hypothetical protein [Streptomyces sp. CB03238]|uniref:hypothetical protein n=1 Tax=Streptomyces sp. CB03238 TaxID=1907777 RepID=UPI00117D3199|nr:hypothetical protein [Streptomyces sp. CB03238]